MINQNVLSFHSGNFSVHTISGRNEAKVCWMMWPGPWPGVSHLSAKLHDERKIISIHPPHLHLISLENSAGKISQIPGWKYCYKSGEGDGDGGEGSIFCLLEA